MKKKPFCFVILDGFGHSSHTTHNAIAQARTPTIDYFIKNYPDTTLHASGEHVGLLPGMMGNSQVGHITIGAGKVIDQPIKLIHEQLYGKLTDVWNTPDIQRLHIMGLLSDAGVHAHSKHFFDAINAALASEVHEIHIHAFLDGRDTPPQSAARYLEQLDEYTQEYNYVTLASIHGRFYAMDRDNNWDRTQQSFKVVTEEQNKTATWQEVLKNNYDNNITDEFIPPIQLNSNGSIKEDDTVLFINFRPDRARQLTTLLLKNKSILPENFITPVAYSNDNTITTKVLFKKTPITNTLKETLSKKGKTILSIAETEKYAHVTYFLGGGHEAPFEHETQELIPSLGIENYKNHPEMSAQKITESVCEHINNDTFDVYIINYANADMVGHSGDMDATIKAIECLDLQLKQLYDTCVVQHHGTMIITADHGNAEDMFDKATKQPRTSHTRNKVPFIVINKDIKNKKIDLQLEGLADIKDFILKNFFKKYIASKN